MWMNEIEVEETLRILGNDPILGEGARFLNSYKEFINSCSDGWAYWRTGTKCADTLSKMLNDAIGAKRGFTRDYKAPTKAEVTKAMNKIKTFAKTNKWLKQENLVFP